MGSYQQVDEKPETALVLEKGVDKAYSMVRLLVLMSDLDVFLVKKLKRNVDVLTKSGYITTPEGGYNIVE